MFWLRRLDSGAVGVLQLVCKTWQLLPPCMHAGSSCMEAHACMLPCVPLGSHITFRFRSMHWGNKRVALVPEMANVALCMHSLHVVCACLHAHICPFACGPDGCGPWEHLYAPAYTVILSPPLLLDHPPHAPCPRPTGRPHGEQDVAASASGVSQVAQRDARWMQRLAVDGEEAVGLIAHPQLLLLAQALLLAPLGRFPHGILS